MPLIKIGNSLHCGLRAVRNSVEKLFSDDKLDVYEGRKHVLHVINEQIEAGADYLLVNVDSFRSDRKEGTKRALQGVSKIVDMTKQVTKPAPLYIESSDVNLLTDALEIYCSQNSLNPPLLGPVSISSLDLLSLRDRYSFSVMGTLLEKIDGSSSGRTEIAVAESYHKTATYLFQRATESGFSPDQIFLDPVIGPIGADYLGFTRMGLEGIKMVVEDKGMSGLHVALDLSSCSEGLPRRLSVEKAYLRVAMEYGLDAALVDATKITGKDLVDGRLLSLIRSVIDSGEEDALAALVDFCKSSPRRKRSQPRKLIDNLLKRDLYTEGKISYGVEMVPSEGELDNLYTFAERAKGSNITVSLTDSPSGHRQPNPDTIASDIGRLMGHQPMVIMSCKSEDRDSLIRRIVSLYEHGIENIFPVTGDYTKAGKAVFDVDAVGLLLAIRCLGRGLDFPSFLPRIEKPLSNLFAGTGVSPFKYTEADVWGQYIKMWKKWRVGCKFFITQVGYDVKKFHELKLYMKNAGISDVPVFGNVYVLTPDAASYLNRGGIPGAHVSDDLRNKHRRGFVAKEESDRIKGMGFEELAEYDRKMSFRRSALLMDILVRGLDYEGIYIGGITDFDDLSEIIELSKELGAGDWRENYEEYRAGDGKREMEFAPPWGFYLFREGDDNLLEDGPYQVADRSSYEGRKKSMELIHKAFFEPGAIGYEFLDWSLRESESHGAGRFVKFMERAIKTETLGCEMCGDCRIAELEYICPEPSWGCYKSLINGPCGGTTLDGMCEVDPERKCYWGKVIESALTSGTMDELYRIQLPKDSSLKHTSSWRNEILGKTGESIVIK